MNSDFRMAGKPASCERIIKLVQSHSSRFQNYSTRNNQPKIAFMEQKDNYPKKIRLMKRPLQVPSSPISYRSEYLAVPNEHDVCKSCLKVNQSPIRHRYHRSPSEVDFIELVEVTPTRMYRRRSSLWSLQEFNENTPPFVPFHSPSEPKLFTNTIEKPPSVMSRSGAPFRNSHQMRLRPPANTLYKQGRKVTFAP